MTPQLPFNPNLKQLRHQAKDLLKAHRNRNASCCQVLRHLRQFEHSSDDEVLSSRVSLVQVQFALAMAYGFEDWPRLRAHVQTLRATEGAREGQVILHDAVGQLMQVRHLIEDYEQPHLDIEMRCVCMRAAGWPDVDYDTLMAVSGASLLFGYDHKDVAPAYAFTAIGLDERIAQATGYESQWVEFEDAEDAWALVKQTIDAGTPVKGHCEGYYVVIMGYEDASSREERKVFSVTNLTDEAWWDWKQFLWRVGDRDTQHKISRHTKEVVIADEKDIALRVLKDAVGWSVNAPEAVREKMSNAKLGLEGISAYADDIADAAGKPADYFASYWRGCYAINPQWTARNSTAVYLGRLGSTNVLSPKANQHVLAAAKHYKSAYGAWQEYDRFLGHKVPEKERTDAWNNRGSRLAGAEAVRKALDHEEDAIGELDRALVAMA